MAGVEVGGPGGRAHGRGLHHLELFSNFLQFNNTFGGAGGGGGCGGRGGRGRPLLLLLLFLLHHVPGLGPDPQRALACAERGERVFIIVLRRAQSNTNFSLLSAQLKL